MLRMIGFGDNIGSGFRKIMNAWESIGYSFPDIHEESEVNEVWLTLPLKNTVENTVENDTVNDTVKAISNLQKNYLSEIIENPTITYLGLCEKLNKSRRTIARATSDLKNLGYISREGSDKTGRWIVIKD